MNIEFNDEKLDFKNLENNTEYFDKISKFKILKTTFERKNRLINILSVSCLEAYINEIAHKNLTKSEFELFDQNSIKGKWLFFTKYISNNTFKLDEEPFGHFSKMISERNINMHSKLKKIKISLNNEHSNDFKTNVIFQNIDPFVFTLLTP